MIHPDTDMFGFSRLLKSKGIQPVALDKIVSSDGQRIVHAYEIGARNAVRCVKQTWSKDSVPRVVILGTGRMAHLCAREFMSQMHCSAVTLAGRRFFDGALSSGLRNADVLVDTIDRPYHELSSHLIPNEFVGLMPDDAIILDITCDCYQEVPARMKTIEGVPHGSPNQWLFPTDDLAYNKMPLFAKNAFRRTVISCVSFPAMTPEESMGHLEERLESVLPSVFRQIELGVRSKKGVNRAFL
jgi:hypothetical protein